MERCSRLLDAVKNVLEITNTVSVRIMKRVEGVLRLTALTLTTDLISSLRFNERASVTWVTSEILSKLSLAGRTKLADVTDGHLAPVGRA